MYDVLTYICFYNSTISYQDDVKVIQKLFGSFSIWLKYIFLHKWAVRLCKDLYFNQIGSIFLRFTELSVYVHILLNSFTNISFDKHVILIFQLFYVKIIKFISRVVLHWKMTTTHIKKLFDQIIMYSGLLLFYISKLFRKGQYVSVQCNNHFTLE